VSYSIEKEPACSKELAPRGKHQSKKIIKMTFITINSFYKSKKNKGRIAVIQTFYNNPKYFLILLTMHYWTETPLDTQYVLIQARGLVTRTHCL
jgi:hypothetical protein